jgi:hypothetical protein
MDERWFMSSIENDELEDAAGSVGCRHESAERVIIDLFDEQSVLQGVERVLVLDAVAVRRSEDLQQADRATKLRELGSGAGSFA